MRYVKGDKLKYLTIIILILSILGCANRAVNLKLSNNYEISDLTQITKIIKSGDFIAIIGDNEKKLAITENFTLDIGEQKIDSKTAFYKLYSENEDRNTSLGRIINEFRIGLQIKGYISKEMKEKNNSSIYVWKMPNNKFVAIVNDNTSGYFLNIIGENINQSKIFEIIK